MSISKDKTIAGLAMSVTLVAANSLSVSHAMEKQDDAIINAVESKSQGVNARALKVYVVTTDSLNVRKGPGTSYASVGGLKKGDKIEVQSITNGWAKFNYNGVVAYVSASYIEETSDTVISGAIGKITADTYLRSSENWDSTKLTLLKSGVEVKVLSKNSNWTKVEYDGKTGYVANDYLKVSTSTGTNQNTNQNTNQGTITEATYIRSSKSWSASKLLLLEKGATVDVLEKEADWSKVSKDGKTGYVANDYLKVSTSTGTNQNTNQNTNQGTITEATYIRSSKSWSASKLLLLEKGAIVEVLERDSEWSKVSKDGKIGYVANSYINTKVEITENKETTKYKVNTDGLNIRKGPATSYESIGTVNSGTILEVYSISNGWAKISYNGGIAYCSSAYIDKYEESKPSTVKYVVNTTTLNVRKGPSVNYDVVGSLHAGDVVEVESISNGWAKISYNGNIAYCSSDYLDKYNGTSTGTSKTIFIDAGHGGTDPGAIGTTYKYKEKDGTLDVVKRIVSKLKAKGHTVKTSRDTDVYVTLANRTAGAKNAKADLFVSIHFNSATSSSAAGIETLYKPDGRNSNVAADKVQKSMVSSLGMRDRGLKTRSDLYVLNNTGTIPAILVEGGFLSNSSDENNIRNAEFREKLANAIVKGIEAYFSVTN